MLEVAAIVQDDYLNNLFFSEKMPQVIPNNIPVPRDDDNKCFKVFKDTLFKNGININTYDLVDNDKVDLEIYFHFNFKRKKYSKIKYCVWPEASEIYSRNNSQQLSRDFDKIFTTLDIDVDDKKFFKINYPINFKDTNFNLYDNRNKFCCILSSNKNLSKYSKKSGYTERVRLIEWFEKNYPNDLSLYGVGWHKFFSSNYYLNRYFSKLVNNFFNKKLIIYKGVAKSKTQVYQDHKFSFCYENVLDKPGYFCELIFDSLNNGCVPIYLGCSNVQDYIPNDCFIDRRNFSSNDELFSFLKSFTSKEYDKYQSNIKNFLNSKKVEPFSIEFFSNQIIKQIKKDFII